MTTKEHIYAIKNVLSKGAVSDDFQFSNRLVLHFMNVARSILTEQKLDKYHSIQSYQSLCTDLIQGSYHNCCGVTLPSSCVILKSTIKLPKLLSARWGDAVKVTTLDGTVIPQFNVTQSAKSSYGIVKTPMGYFIHDNYLYVLNNSRLKKVLINGLWASPEDITTLNCPSSDSPCSAYDDVYPIDSDLVAPMYKLVLEYLTIKSPQDNVNDSRAPEDLRKAEPNEA